jgi:hypothetical protein
MTAARFVYPFEQDSHSGVKRREKTGSSNSLSTIHLYEDIHIHI